MKNAAAVTADYLSVGETKAGMPARKQFLSGIFAGAFIALGGLGSQIAALAAPGAGKLAGACVFPVGLTLVVIVGTELFTGNCLLSIPWLAHRVRLSAVLKNWLFVYLGNFAGGLLIAAMANLGHVYGMFDGAALTSVLATANTKASLSFGDAFLRGILCNVLVCLAVWLAMSATEAAGKIIGLCLPVMLFVLCGFEHSVANMYFIPAGMIAGALTGADAPGIAGLLHNLIPVTLGNIVGGSVCIGAAFWLLYGKKEA